MNNEGQPGFSRASTDIQALVTYPFKDAEWVSKVVVGSLLALVPILNFPFLYILILVPFY